MFQMIATAINELYSEYKLMMMDLALGILKDYQYAEDAVQEACLKLSQNMSKIDDIHSKRSRNFVYSVTKNQAISIYRKRKLDEDVQFAESLNYVAGDIDIAAFGNEHGFSDEIIAAISQLDEQDKDILCYKYGDEYSGKEIAKIIGRSPDYVYKRLQRATTKLEKILLEMKGGLK